MWNSITKVVDKRKDKLQRKDKHTQTFLMQFLYGKFLSCVFITKCCIICVFFHLILENLKFYNLLELFIKFQGNMFLFNF